MVPKALTKAMGKASLWLKRSSPTLLGIAASGGVVLTVIFAVKETPKAMKAIEQKQEEKGEKLTRLETVSAALPSYIPMAVAGVLTVSCIVGSTVISHRQQTALIAGYAALESYISQYKAKAEVLLGKDGAAEIEKEIIRDNYTERVPTGKEPDPDAILLYVPFLNRYVSSTMEELIDAEYHMNRKLAQYGEVSVNDFCDFISTEQEDWGDFVGWSVDMMDQYCDFIWLDFHNEKVIMDDGGEVFYVNVSLAPSERYLEEWGFYNAASKLKFPIIAKDTRANTEVIS